MFTDSIKKEVIQLELSIFTPETLNDFENNEHFIIKQLIKQFLCIFHNTINENWIIEGLSSFLSLDILHSLRNKNENTNDNKEKENTNKIQNEKTSKNANENQNENKNQDKETDILIQDEKFDEIQIEINEEFCDDLLIEIEQHFYQMIFSENY